MGSSQSISAFVGVKQTPTYIKIKLEDGSFVPGEIDSYIITTSVGDEFTILDQEFNYAVKLGDITTEEANSYLVKKGFPILTNGSKFGLFRAFGHHGEHTMKDCFAFFPENSVKSFCFAFNGNNNGFTISKERIDFTIDLAFLKSFLGMTKTFDATALGDFPTPQTGKAPVAALSTAKVSSASSWVSVAKSNTPTKTVVCPPTLEEIQDEEVKLTAQLAALSIKKELAKKAAAEELKLLEEEEKSNKLRELAIKDRQAKLKLALQSN
jgi:hypothetical protein